PNDSVTVGAAGLVASGLQYFVVSTGTGDDLFEIDSPNYALPAAGGGVVFQAGSGGDTFVGNADTGYTLADSGGTSPPEGGTGGFPSGENASPTGGGGRRPPTRPRRAPARAPPRGRAGTPPPRG